MTDTMKALDEIQEALRQMIYETTSLSPLEDDGSHKCRITKGALEAARQAYHQTIPTLRAALAPAADDEVGAIRTWVAANEQRFATWHHDVGDGEIAFDFLVTLLSHVDRLSAELAKERERVRLFMGAACPVATEINPRGYNWSEAYLDQAHAATITKDTP